MDCLVNFVQESRRVTEGPEQKNFLFRLMMFLSERPGDLMMFGVMAQRMIDKKVNPFKLVDMSRPELQGALTLSTLFETNGHPIEPSRTLEEMRDECEEAVDKKKTTVGERMAKARAALAKKRLKAKKDMAKWGGDPKKLKFNVTARADRARLHVLRLHVGDAVTVDKLQRLFKCGDSVSSLSTSMAKDGIIRKQGKTRGFYVKTKDADRIIMEKYLGRRVVKEKEADLFDDL